jgi:putative phosphoesterase
MSARLADDHFICSGGKMRVAVLSDIHGNCIALDRALEDLVQHPVEKIVCLGDAIQGGPQPAEVVKRLRQFGFPVVMGNADAWLLTGKDTGNEVTSDERKRVLDAVREWSLSELSAEDRAFIEGFQATVEVELEAGRRLLCFHGSPASFDDIMLPDTPQDQLFKLLGNYPADALAGGHTHVQYVHRLGSDGRIFFNPGSIGLAYSHHQPEDDFRADPWAEYAVFTSEHSRLALEFRRVPYDPAPLIEVYRTSGRPYADQAIAQYRGR